MDGKKIIELMVDGLLKMKQDKYTEEYMLNKLEKFKNFDYKKLSDDEIFWIITYIMFFNMGKKASMIEKKLPMFRQDLYGYKKLINLKEEEILSIIQKIGFGVQIRRVIKNANMFDSIILKHGSFKNYLENVFDIKDIYASNDKLMRLHKAFQRFAGYGQTAPWHLITELGFMSLKPDTVIRRIFNRLGLLDDIDNMNRCIEIGREISKSSGLPIRYVDIVIVKYGQVGESDLLGTKDGICTENNPKCNMCELKNDCLYYNNLLHGNAQILDNIDDGFNSVHNRKVEKDEIIKQVSANEITRCNHLELERYKNSNEHTKKLVYYLCNEVRQHNIKFKVKYRKDAIALTFEDNEKKNIATVWINRDSINILVLNADGQIGIQNKKGKRCFNQDDISEEVINAIYNRYTSF